MNRFLIFLLIASSSCAFAQQAKPVDDSITTRLGLQPRQYTLPDARAFGETITTEDMKILIDTLASNTMEGRETGQQGQRLAADFIAQQFKSLGLPEVADRRSYFQNIYLQRESWSDLGLKVEDQEFKNRVDYFVFPAQNVTMPTTRFDELVFVGYGIEEGKYNDYGKTDVKGKAVVFYNNDPLDDQGKSLLTGSEARSAWTLDWKRKVQLATSKGAAMVFVIDPDLENYIKNNRRQMFGRGWEPYSPNMAAATQTTMVNSIFISSAVAKALFGKKAEDIEEAHAALLKREAYKPVKFKTDVEVRMVKEVKTLQGSNVIGFIEGSDEAVKDEYIIITAHYDHLGLQDGKLFNGADDNASGTSGVIEIARAFAKAKAEGKGPRRSVVCMLVSGEEKGLLGSRFYVDFPIFPLDRTVANINIDMIGRVDSRHADNPNYIYVIGSNRMSTELHEINEYANAVYTKLDLDYKYNDPSDPNRYYERSDHYNFAERGVPAIFYFNGTHPDYHRHTDTAEKIDPAAAAKRAQLAFYTAWDLANRPLRITADVRK